MRRIAVDVRVVEFGAGDDRGARPVVQELGPFVEVRGVVLVAFDDEMLAVAEAEPFVEIERDAADEQARVTPRMMEHVREQARRRRLAVRAGDHDRMARGEEQLLERLGKAHVRDASPAQRLRFGILGADHVADHGEIRLRGFEVGGRERRVRLDPPLGQLVGHGRVNVLVGAGNLVPGRP